MLEIRHSLVCFFFLSFFPCVLYNSVDTVDFGIQVLVFRVVRSLSKAESRRPIALAHRGLALLVGGCGGDRVESGNDNDMFVV